MPQVQLYLMHRNCNTLHKLEKKNKWDIHSDSENVKEKPNKFYPSLERTTSLKEITQVVTTASKTRPRQKTKNNMLAAQAKLNPWKKADTYSFTITLSVSWTGFLFLTTTQSFIQSLHTVQ